MTSNLILREHGKPLVAALTPGEFVALEKSNAGLDIRVTREPGVYELKASQIVGTIVLPTRIVRVVPKIPIDRLLFLLGFAPEMLELAGPALASREPDFVAVMKQIFETALTTVLARGLRREYRQETDDLSQVRGAIDVGRLVLTRFGVFPPIPCRFQEYTIDTEPNRRLLAAARSLVNVGNKLDSTSLALRRLCMRFEGVSHVHYEPGRFRPVSRTRLLAEYEPALGIAELVLANTSFEMNEGATRGVAFLVDMNRVYERFAVRSLGRALGLGDDEWVYQPRNLYADADRRIKLEPDVLWRGRDRRPLVIVDAKYKETTRPVREDVYQVVTYCTALGVRDAVLLYASSPDQTHHVTRAGVRIHQWCLDPTKPPMDLGPHIAEIADKLRGLLPNPHSAA